MRSQSRANIFLSCLSRFVSRRRGGSDYEDAFGMDVLKTGGGEGRQRVRETVCGWKEQQGYGCEEGACVWKKGDRMM